MQASLDAAPTKVRRRRALRWPWSVTVTNVDEAGTVTLSASQPRIGVEIRADDARGP